jgi:3-oxoacyl-[acyl-carrier-protein] synthase-3
LNKDTGCFDINLGCSAYPYGIAVLSSLLKNSDKTKALLLVGETVSKQVSNKDKTNAFLFGDAGTATLIELTNDSSNATFFSFSSDGNGFGSLIIPGGGYRHVSSSKTLEEHLDPDGNIRTDEHLFMDGMEIFNFAITRVPKDIKDICAFSGTSLDDIDYFVFHQANKYINNFIAKKLKLLPEKVPFSIKDYGNTSGASIPMTLVDNFDKFDNKCTKCLFSGFGVGLSWSSCIVDLDGVVILPMIKFDK